MSVLGWIALWSGSLGSLAGAMELSNPDCQYNLDCSIAQATQDQQNLRALQILEVAKLGKKYSECNYWYYEFRWMMAEMFIIHGDDYRAKLNELGKPASNAAEKEAWQKLLGTDDSLSAHLAGRPTQWAAREMWISDSALQFFKQTPFSRACNEKVYSHPDTAGSTGLYHTVLSTEDQATLNTFRAIPAGTGPKLICNAANETRYVGITLNRDDSIDLVVHPGDWADAKTKEYEFRLKGSATAQSGKRFVIGSDNKGKDIFVLNFDPSNQFGGDFTIKDAKSLIKYPEDHFSANVVECLERE